ncbi:MAG TPA: F0F1 ATP synthase subunit A [Patescibacteria group bacterium]|nr:F0F1 ATP synthase subunit A [Patescibacteria group bacterium]
MTSDPETATTRAETPRPPSKRRRNILIFAMLAVVVVNVLALILVPPQSKADPTAPYSFPADAIKDNIKPIPPHVVFDLDPNSAPGPNDLIFFDLTLTNTIFTMWIVMIVAFVLIFAGTRGRREVPGPLQNVVEFLYEGLSDFGTSLGGPKAKAFIPLFATLFVFIILSNWSGLVPPVGKVDLLRGPTSDINVTLGLALVSFLTFHVSGLRALGVGGYIGKFFSLREFRNGVAPGLIALFVGLIEFTLEFVKPITLAMRLFGNIYGGGLALAVITSLTLMIIPVALVGLETFVGFVQALIFSVLTLIFTMLAIEGHHEEQHETHDVSGEMPERANGPTGKSLSPHGHAA